MRALCVAAADGTDATPLPHTICATRCRLDLVDDATQLVWAKPGLLLYGDDFRIFAIRVGGRPEPLGRQPGSFQQFSVDSAGDRVAAGFTSCPQCAGPVTVLSVPSGRVVGRVGGKQFDNVTPSLSPDGEGVVFVRQYAGDSGRPDGIWTASTDGSRLRRLVPDGSTPLWSPGGGTIAYVRSGSLRLVPPQGGASTTLVARNVEWLFGWSPDGKQLAFQGEHGGLEVVNVSTGTPRRLLRLGFAPSVVWSSSSHELLVKTQPRRQSRCSSLWRVPAGGGKPRLLRSC